jgi:hypothetical protein
MSAISSKARAMSSLRAKIGSDGSTLLSGWRWPDGADERRGFLASTVDLLGARKT